MEEARKASTEVNAVTQDDFVMQPSDLLALGLHGMHDRVDVRLAALQQGLERARIDAAAALPQLSESSASVALAVRRASERARVGVCVVSPRLPPPDMGLAAGLVTQMFARGRRPVRSADPAAFASGLGEDDQAPSAEAALEGGHKSLLPQGVHARAEQVALPPSLDPARLPLPEWCTRSAVTVVVLTPQHTALAARLVMQLATDHSRRPHRVFVGLLGQPGEGTSGEERGETAEEGTRQTAAAAAALVELAREVGVPAERVAVLPVSAAGAGSKASAEEPQLQDARCDDSSAASPNAFPAWCELLHASAMECVEEAFEAASESSKAVLPVVEMWRQLRANPSKPGKMVAWLLARAVEGIPKVNLLGAQQLATSHLSKNPMLERGAVSAMVNHNSAITFGSGFLTGLGGFVTFPVAVPTALGVALVLRLRLCLAIGVLGGYADLSPTCLAAVLLCVFGADPLPVLQQKSPELLRQQAGACKSTNQSQVLEAVSVAMDKISPDALVQQCENAAWAYAEQVRAWYISQFDVPADEGNERSVSEADAEESPFQPLTARETEADAVAAEAFKMRLPLEIVRVLPGVMFTRVTGNVVAYGAELVPVVGGVISGGVDAGITKAAGLAAMNAFLGKNVAVGKVTPLSNLLSPTSKDVHSSGGDPAPGSAAERMAEARLAAGKAAGEARVAAEKATEEARVAAARAGEWAKEQKTKAGVWAAGLWAKMDQAARNIPKR